MDSTPELVEFIRYYTGSGWRLIPWAFKNGQKVPCIKDWPNQGSLDLAVIQDWLSQFPGCKFGAVTGQGSNLVVIDVDNKGDLCGGLTLAFLMARWGRLPETPVRTPSRGYHLFFRYPSGAEIRNSAGRLGPGLDVRANGGWIALAPSQVNGRTYTWDAVKRPDRLPLADLPWWAVDLMAHRPTPIDLTPLPPFPMQEGGIELLPSPGRGGVGGDELRVPVGAEVRPGLEGRGKSWAAVQLKQLAPWRCDQYDAWIQVGMSLTSLGEAGLRLWDEWSRLSPKYHPGECAQKWGTFQPTRLSLGSLAYWARIDHHG
jgi:hypothetical protein